jgi:polysaccharide chain length determinant protein (PEP-CTERM system associated)
MGSIDLKYYLSIFWRRFPYFLVIAVFVSAIGLTVASILPPVYRSTASLLVERQQIPGDLASSTVPVDAIEMIQIIEQRLMTRANLLDMANRFGVYADRPGISANDIVSDMRARTTFQSQAPRGRGSVGATIISVSFESPSPAQAAQITNELTTLILRENAQMRTGRATDTLEFFEQEVDRLAAELDRKSSEILEFKNANQDSLPDSLASRRNQQTIQQERLLQLEREETALRDARDRTVRIYEQTGRVVSNRQRTREEEDLETLRQQLAQARLVYSETSPAVTQLKTRISVLEPIVAEQIAMLNPDFLEMSEIEIQLAQIDGRLEFIAGEKARIEAELADIERSIRETPANELSLGALERDRSNLQSQYDAAVSRASQAAVGERLELLAKGERFTLIEQATPPESPLKPNRLLIGGGSVIAGLGAGAGFILLLELLNRSVRRPVEITAKLGIEPFATVPYIHTQREMRWKRGVVGAALALVVVGIPAALFALHTFYLPLDLILRNLASRLGLDTLLAQIF